MDGQTDRKRDGYEGAEGKGRWKEVRKMDGWGTRIEGGSERKNQARLNSAL